MNLELQNHRITLGPKALAFIETNMRGMGETYCRDQLALWLAGGKVDADVRIEGPARFVAAGNEIGVPMKAGAEARERGTLPTGSTEPLPVASAAPVDSEWPKFMWGDRTRTELFVHRGPGPRDAVRYAPLGHVYGATDQPWGWCSKTWPHLIVASNEALAFLRKNGHAKVADELERQAPDAGLQVWQYDTSRYIVKPDSTVVRSLRGAGWFRSNNKWQDSDIALSTRLTGPEADKAIAEAKKQGVI